jgi:hypothetical protein
MKFLFIIFLIFWNVNQVRPKTGPLFLPNAYNVVNNPLEDQLSALNNYPQDCFLVRNVPGDGSCLFHAIAVCLKHKISHTNEIFDETTSNLSRWLRNLACDVLSGKSKGNNISLVIEPGADTINLLDLQSLLAEKYNQTFSEYCSKMRDDLTTWGGGPEILALCNYFECPIHVYELCSVDGKQFSLRVKALFGSPNFDGKFPIFLLSADGRFPRISPGSQKAEGDHFLALFPSKHKLSIGHASSSYSSHFTNVISSLKKIFGTSKFYREKLRSVKSKNDDEFYGWPHIIDESSFSQIKDSWPLDIKNILGL